MTDMMKSVCGHCGKVFYWDHHYFGAVPKKGDGIFDGDICNECAREQADERRHQDQMRAERIRDQERDAAEERRHRENMESLKDLGQTSTYSQSAETTEEFRWRVGMEAWKTAPVRTVYFNYLRNLPASEKDRLEPNSDFRFGYYCIQQYISKLSVEDQVKYLSRNHSVISSYEELRDKSVRGAMYRLRMYVYFLASPLFLSFVYFFSKTDLLSPFVGIIPVVGHFFILVYLSALISLGQLMLAAIATFTTCIPYFMLRKIKPVLPELPLGCAKVGFLGL